MSEIITLGHLKSHPIMGTWSIAGAAEEYPGFLSLEDDNLNLTIYVTIGGNTHYGVLQQTDPRFIPFAPPNQPTLHGQTKAAGRITLFNCAQLSAQSAIRLDPPEARVELILRPQQAWFGNGFVSPQALYKQLSFRAPGLHNVLTTLYVDHQFLVKSKPRQKSPTHQLKKLTGANQAFLVYQQAQPEAQIARNGKSYSVQFASSISQSSSSTKGVAITTSDLVIIRSEGAVLAELLNMAVEMEHFLCLLCIGPVRGERVTVQLDSFGTAELLWQIGRPEGRRPFTIMPHEILVRLGAAPEIARQAIEKWFGASEYTAIGALAYRGGPVQRRILNS
jgi:hypothetical protein